MEAPDGAGEDEARRHKGKGHRHAADKQKEHDAQAHDAQVHRAHARKTVCGHIPGQKNRHGAENKRKGHAAGPHALYPFQQDQHVKKKRHHKRAEAEADIPHKGIDGHAQLMCDGGRGQGHFGRGPDAHRAGGRAPDGGGRFEHGSIFGAQSFGDNIHGHMVFPALGIRDAGKNHQGHEHFRDFMRSGYGAVEEITQKNVEERQQHDDAETADAADAEPLAENGKLPRGPFRA